MIYLPLADFIFKFANNLFQKTQSMTGIMAMIFFDVLAHAATSVLWGLLVAVALSLLIIFIVKGLYTRADITALGWIGLVAYGLVILILATVMAGAIKLNSAVDGVMDAVAGRGAVDIPSWIATYLGGLGIYSSSAVDTVVDALDELSSSLVSTAWKMVMWMAFFSVLAVIIACRQASAIQRRRVSPVRSRRRVNDVDDF